MAADRHDPEFTKLLGNHLMNAKGFYDWGIDRGLTSPEDMRITIAKRKETAKQLVDSGMSRRQAAKALGVAESTVRNDLGAQKLRESAQELRTTKPAATRTAHEAIAKFAFDQPAIDVPPGDPIRHGDFRDLAVELKDNSVDLVFTDPPYNDESLPLYGSMAEVAARVLKPGGSLVTYCGNAQVLKAGEAIAAHLRFWQPLCCLHTGPVARLTEFGVVVQFKPMLWFVKGTRSDKYTFVNNVVSGQREKSHHNWQQAESEAAYFIEALSPLSGFVVDFFAGSGTTIIAAQRLGRWAIGYEKSAKHHAAAVERMEAAVPSPFQPTPPDRSC
jgi:site-specific DNA-methyltransferase (adenine-specific)